MKWQISCPEWLMAYGTAEKSAAMNHVPVEAVRSIRSAVADDLCSELEEGRRIIPLVIRPFLSFLHLSIPSIKDRT